MKFKVYVDYTAEEIPRPFYVGKGNDNRVRSLLGRNQLHESIARKYGINRAIEFETDDEQEALAKERELITKYKTFMNHEPGQWGANFTEGGDGTSGWIPSEETRRKIGIASSNRRDSEETRKKKSDAAIKLHTGLKRSEETRRKLSEARKGKTPWNKGKTLGKREVPRTFSEQARKNISEARKGRAPSNKVVGTVRIAGGAGPIYVVKASRCGTVEIFFPESGETAFLPIASVRQDPLHS